MRDWQDGKLRYLVHFSDGGSGMRHPDEPLNEDDERREGGRRYTVARVEQAPNPNALGHCWARLEFQSARSPLVRVVNADSRRTDVGQTLACACRANQHGYAKTA